MLSSPIQNKEDNRSRFTWSLRSDGYFYLWRSGDLHLTIADPRAHWHGQGGWSRDTLTLDGNSSNIHIYREWMGLNLFSFQRLSASFTFSFWFLTIFWAKCKIPTIPDLKDLEWLNVFFCCCCCCNKRKNMFQSQFVNGFLRKLPGLAGALPQLWRTDYNNNWL